jgi:hypothetical protein
LQLAGLDAPGLILAGAAMVAVHLGMALYGISAFHGWLDRRRERRTTRQSTT